MPVTMSTISKTLKTRGTTLLLLLLLVQTQVKAGFYTGNDLLRDLQNPGTSRAEAIGYVMGVVDSIDHARKLGGLPRDFACFDIQARVTGGQVGDTVRIWLEKNPQYRHYGGQALAVAALAEAFPCKQERR